MVLVTIQRHSASVQRSRPRAPLPLKSTRKRPGTATTNAAITTNHGNDQEELIVQVPNAQPRTAKTLMMSEQSMTAERDQPGVSVIPGMDVLIAAHTSRSPAADGAWLAQMNQPSRTASLRKLSLSNSLEFF